MDRSICREAKNSIGGTTNYLSHLFEFFTGAKKFLLIEVPLFYRKDGEKDLVFSMICLVNSGVDQDRDLRTIRTLKVKGNLGEGAAQQKGGYELRFIEELSAHR